MIEKELKLECELLIRKKSYYVSVMFFCFVAFMCLVRLSLPYAKNHNGFLIDYGLEQYIPDMMFLFISFLFLSGRIIYLILCTSLRIKGVIIITSNHLEVTYWGRFNYWGKYKYHFTLASIRNLKLDYNYIKINDTEPRNVVDGNNNIIRFRKMGIPFKYEFMVETMEEEDILYAILENWKTNKITFDYSETKADM